MNDSKEHVYAGIEMLAINDLREFCFGELRWKMECLLFFCNHNYKRTDYTEILKLQANDLLSFLKNLILI